MQFVNRITFSSFRQSSTIMMSFTICCDDAKNRKEIGIMASFNETDINPPAELGRLAEASGDKRSTRIKIPVV